ncbi:MAG: TlpA disulfide reductase family protein, partial [Phycisphaerales bacterium]
MATNGLLAAMAVLVTGVAAIGQDDGTRFDLMVGDAAPALAIGEWARGDPIERFEPGRVYVLSFFSTYCRYCAAAAPELSGLDAELPSVRVIGVNIRERDAAETVPAYLDSMGDALSFWVAIEKDRAMDRAWMRPAGPTTITHGTPVRPA